MQMLSALLRRYVEGDREGFRVSASGCLIELTDPKYRVRDAAVACMRAAMGCPAC